MHFSELRFLFSRINQSLRKGRKRKSVSKFIEAEKQSISQMLKASPEAPKKGTLIVKCDDIGDFLIWQHTIPYFRDKLEGPLYFAGNQVIRELYENYFDFADECVWINKGEWQNQAYRHEIYRKIRALNAKLAIEPMFTRNYEMDDLMMQASGADHKVAWSSAHHTYYPDLAAIRGIMNQEISSEFKQRLEYFRNFEFFSKLLNLPEPGDFKAIFSNFSKQKRLVLIPVGSIASKSWPADCYVKLLKEVAPLFDSILLLGGRNAVEVSSHIEKVLGEPKLINLSGQTSLMDMIAFIGESEMLLSPDTFAVHLAAMTATDTVVISNGHQWQRFLNYAPWIRSGMKLVFPPHVNRDESVYKTWHSRGEIARVKVKDVKKAILELKTKSSGKRQI